MQKLLTAFFIANFVEKTKMQKNVVSGKSVYSYTYQIQVLIIAILHSIALFALIKTLHCISL